jgi:hypothetical protein
MSQRREALEEALKLASQLADPKLLVARLVGVRSIVNFHFFRLRQAVDDGFQSEQMGGSEAPPWQRAVQLRALYPALVYLGTCRGTTLGYGSNLYLTLAWFSRID